MVFLYRGNHKRYQQDTGYQTSSMHHSKDIIMMRKTAVTLLAAASLFVFAGCGETSGGSSTGNASSSGNASSGSASQNATTGETVAGSGDGKTLVAYFSLPDSETDDSTVTVDGENLGNVQYMAMTIADSTGADLFRIEPATPYTTDHDALTEVALQEQRDNARPELAANVENFDQYDTVFLGYPIWWSDMPQILYTFMESNDFAGKTVIPFSSHGGSGLAGTVESITRTLPDATVVENALSISRNDMESTPDRVSAWLQELGY